MNHDELVRRLKEEDPVRLRWLHDEGDRVRREHVGDEVYLRGLLELSNYCVRRCGYCGINAGNSELRRYRMTHEEIRAGARLAKELGYGTVVMQAGEDFGLTREFICEAIRIVKGETGGAVTLSLGERNEDELLAWHEAGADRYLMRFETSNRPLYDRIHPPLRGERSDRQALLIKLREMGYEVGSGFLVGIPGQTYDDLARDLELLKELDLDMVGIGPYIMHPRTALAETAARFHREAGAQQVPNTSEFSLTTLALVRLLLPDTNIPSTTALSTIDSHGREHGLSCGANVIMPNLTPPEYRELYEIYPGKSCLQEAKDFHLQLELMIAGLGRSLGKGPGHSPRFRKRAGV